jgi:hypothetical protein
MALVFLDLVRVASTTTGTGTTVALGAADPGFRSFAAAGAVNGDTFRYAIEDGANREVGTAVYNSAGPTMTRTFSSSSTGAILNLSGGARVSMTALGIDVGAGAKPALSGVIVRTGGVVTSVTEIVDGDPRVTTLTRTGGLLSSVSVSYRGETRTTNYTRIGGQITGWEPA